MNTYKYLFFLMLPLFLFSCESNRNPVPENNNFSYLDSNSTQQEPKAANPVSSNSLNTNDLSCLKIHKELIGSIISKNISATSGNHPDYRKSNILSLTTPFSLDCSNNQKITTTEIVLNISPEIDIDQYLGSTVLAIGEISNKSGINNDFPLEMNVIRLEATKGSIK